MQLFILVILLALLGCECRAICKAFAPERLVFQDQELHCHGKCTFVKRVACSVPNANVTRAVNVTHTLAHCLYNARHPPVPARVSCESCATGYWNDSCSVHINIVEESMVYPHDAPTTSYFYLFLGVLVGVVLCMCCVGHHAREIHHCCGHLWGSIRIRPSYFETLDDDDDCDAAALCAPPSDPCYGKNVALCAPPSIQPPCGHTSYYYQQQLPPPPTFVPTASIVKSDIV